MWNSFVLSIGFTACEEELHLKREWRRPIRHQWGGIVAIILTFASPSVIIAQERLSTFDEVASLIENQFFDPNMNGLDWRDHIATYRARVQPDMSIDAFAEVVNEMLGALDASHTRLYVRESHSWYQLAGVFLPHYDALRDSLKPYLTEGELTYTGIGIFVETRKEGEFVIGVLDGHPAETAGVLLGDRIVSVDDQPFHQTKSFEGRAGLTTPMIVERHPGDHRSIEVRPTVLDASTMFEDAMRASARLIEVDGLDIGYLHAWSYAGQRYHDILTETLLYGELKNAQALVLDLRGGWGGANSSFLNLFAAESILTTSTDRAGEVRSFQSAWTRPVVLLVDGGTRSGKEVFAQGFQTSGIGPIVGERTAGAVLAGRINALSDRSLLYVAAADINIDGVRLEGRGVAPDVMVTSHPAYGAGDDPQLDQALIEAVKMVLDNG